MLKSGNHQLILTGFLHPRWCRVYPRTIYPLFRMVKRKRGREASFTDDSVSAVFFFLVNIFVGLYRGWNPTQLSWDYKFDRPGFHGRSVGEKVDVAQLIFLKKNICIDWMDGWMVRMMMIIIIILTITINVVIFISYDYIIYNYIYNDYIEYHAMFSLFLLSNMSEIALVWCIRWELCQYVKPNLKKRLPYVSIDTWDFLYVFFLT